MSGNHVHVVPFVTAIAVVYGVPLAGALLLRRWPAARPRLALFGLLFGALLLQTIVLAASMVLIFAGPPLRAPEGAALAISNLLAGGASWLLLLLTAVLRRPRQP